MPFHAFLKPAPSEQNIPLLLLFLVFPINFSFIPTFYSSHLDYNCLQIQVPCPQL